MLETMLGDDFVWGAIQSALSGKRRTSHTQFLNINCPMCVERGESADRRQRCGIKKNADGLGISCFNCGFRSRFKIGQAISQSMLKFLSKIGISDREVSFLKFKALQYRRMLEGSPAAQEIIPLDFVPSFHSMKLPEGSRSLTQWAKDSNVNSDFLAVAEYLFDRGEVISSAMEYYWTPSTEHDLNRRLIIPFTYQGRTIGWTGRLVDPSTEEKPKYFSSVPSNYLFNSQVLNLNREFVIVVEGPFDAIAIDNVSTLGAKLSVEQAMWLNSSPVKKIVLADRDESGQRMIDNALKYNWMVAFPKLADGHGFQNWWDKDVKDAADAVKRYGKLYTIRSIMESVAKSKMEISVKRKLLF